MFHLLFELLQSVLIKPVSFCSVIFTSMACPFNGLLLCEKQQVQLKNSSKNGRYLLKKSIVIHPLLAEKLH